MNKIFTTTQLYLLVGILLLNFAFSQAQTTVNGSFEFGGINRTYSFYVPASYTPGNPVPMVIGLHGLSSSGSNFAQYRDFRSIADTANFIVVHPDGSTMVGVRFWNYGSIFGATVDDVGFLEALIDTISAQYSINQQRVYCVGMSNGSFMSYYMACQSNRFAAIGGVTGSMSVDMYNSCNPAYPIPTIHIHGTDDSTNPYTGTSTMAAIEDVTMFWVNQNECNTTPTVFQIPNIDPNDDATAERYLYSGGVNGHTVELFKVIGGGHSWPNSPMPGSSEVTCMDFDGCVEIWRFFSQYEKSGVAAIEDLSKIELKIWPNPTNGMVYIQADNQIVTDVTLFDLQGRMVVSITEENIESIDLSHLKSGNYVVNVSGGDFFVVKKLIVSN